MERYSSRPSARGLEVQHQLESSRLQDRQLGRLGALKDLADIGARATIRPSEACRVCDRLHSNSELWPPPLPPFSDAGPLFPGSPAIGSQRLSGWRAGPSADAVRLRQMAWVAETAKMLPPHALYQQCVTLYVCSNAKFWLSPSQSLSRFARAGTSFIMTRSLRQKLALRARTQGFEPGNGWSGMQGSPSTAAQASVKRIPLSDAQDAPSVPACSRQ
jgi:hypothetical protein